MQVDLSGLIRKYVGEVRDREGRQLLVGNSAT